MASVAITLGLLGWVDRSIGNHEGGGPYREEIPRPLRVVQHAPGAQHLVIGCSTSNWFPDALPEALAVSKGAVVDGHMSDCLQTCTLAEARRLRALGRHFSSVTFGVNTFEYCEDYRERRSMQEVELMPLANSLELARVYLHSDEPLRYAGGWFMNHISLVYGNTMWLQRHTRKAWFGNESADSEWFRPHAPKPGRKKDAFSCDYVAADRGFGLAATRGALLALSDLADRVRLVLLPDRSYAEDTAEAVAGRELFAREHHQLVAGFQRVDLVDLLDPKLTRRELFRDGAHLNVKGVRAAKHVLTARLRELPPLPDAGGERAAHDGEPPPRVVTHSEPSPVTRVEPGTDTEVAVDPAESP
jgi:hypothetical protein